MSRDRDFPPSEEVERISVWGDSSPKDCRIVHGDRAVIISWSTAVEALAAMKAQAKAGAYRELMADDASFVRAAMAELEKAAE